MLGWVITCHDDNAQDMLHRLEEKYGPLAQCQVVSFWHGLSSNMLSRMMCDALHAADSGDGVIFLTDIAGSAPYRVAALMSHKHPACEVISGISYPLLERMLLSRESMSSSAFRDEIVSLGGPGVTSLWHQQQKNPPFVLLHDLYEY
ncbi:PTS sugar transporter subunit IIA [Citrobacter freundii]|uniref:PTS sugar transporter subunit IIA n=1 Tax=Citrobacter murliniae TaxID=67829 RepID=A0ABY2PWJ9_9ENTR|nr:MULTISPECIES: PTS sugar transporter subunit IIA [Citrobacter]MCQ7057046.1 PTS sugar transporter subunit IIA [Escherichia coli]KLV63404.1 PTS system ascorbate-specific IIA component [Citrobacter sp. MGH106]MBJ9873000.1 PTS sugar transporter subunit IIA [Citrobacter werkmanii]MDK2358784.1 PTS sugar transporter subunit IIA [Citrobacter freundii]MDM2931783.1 PTS sugar transporter subunit IIA [Citrobacter sp. Cm046]